MCWPAQHSSVTVTGSFPLKIVYSGLITTVLHCTIYFSQLFPPPRISDDNSMLKFINSYNFYLTIISAIMQNKYYLHPQVV